MTKMLEGGKAENDNGRKYPRRDDAMAERSVCCHFNTFNRPRTIYCLRCRPKTFPVPLVSVRTTRAVNFLECITRPL